MRGRRDRREGEREREGETRAGERQACPLKNSERKREKDVDVGCIDEGDGWVCGVWVCDVCMYILTWTNTKRIEKEQRGE